MASSRYARSRKRKKRHSQFQIEPLEPRLLLASDWQNPFNSLDTNADDDSSPIDALLIINEVNLPVFSNSTGRLPALKGDPASPFLDTTGDQFVSSLDALFVINLLNGDIRLPSLTGQLVNDSAPGGGTNNDGITSDAKISGTIENANGAVTVWGSVDDGDPVPISVDAQGQFTFEPNLPLDGSADGPHRLHLSSIDNASIVVGRDITLFLDTVAPIPHSLRLTSVTDTGRSDHDGITQNTRPSVSGHAEPKGEITLFRDGATPIQVRASDLGVWETSFGDLTEGEYRVRARLEDSAGNLSGESTDYLFVIDTTAPPSPQFALTPSSDTGERGDEKTSAGRVTLRGQSESLASLTLTDASIVAAATATGTFTIPDVELAEGENILHVRAADAAGNISESSRTLTRVAAEAEVDPVIRWNQALLAAIQMDSSTPPTASRGMAMVSLAVYDTLNAIEGTPAYVVARVAPPNASAIAAISSAAHDVLQYLFPAQQTSFDALLDESLQGIPDGDAKANGVAFGHDMAAAIIAWRAADGWDDYLNYVPRSEVGSWTPTTPMYDVALLPQWADLTPFALDSADELRPQGPPSFDSQAYTTAYDDVRRLGAQFSSERTADQTQIARFWADGPGTITPPGHWNQLAQQIATARGNSISSNARLFAELNVALADAAIVAWDAKYAYNSWRPVTAIQGADSDGNVQTTADADWLPLLITPPFPEYVSGHSTFSAAAATVLTQIFGENVSFTTTSPGLPDVQRSFTSFQTAAEEAGRSRIYGGIHFEFANQDGLTLGRETAQRVLERFSVATDERAPTIVFDDPMPTNSATNIAVSGRVLDNLTGAASLQLQVDNAAFVELPFDAQGRFTFTTSFAVNGTAEGLHVLRFRARDAVGNISVPIELRFVLDTVLPSISLQDPSAGSQVRVGDSLTGTVSGTGSEVVSLTYRWDNGPIMPVPFELATGQFDWPLDLSKIVAGSHELSVSAQDAAGHTNRLNVTVDLPQTIPFQITSYRPLDAAEEVGTTFRPQFFFSRRIDPSSLNDTNFYASFGETKLPARIVAAGDGSFASLFLQNPMPGSARIQLHVDGDTIHAADGSLLDANGDGTPGGLLESTFMTVSLSPLPGTSLAGRVLDVGPDLKPMTLDDIRAGADQALHTADDVFLLPIAGVKVFIVGLEDQAVQTDAQGNFHFDAVPAGDVKLAIDGHTATNAPAGYYFPEMVMDLNLVAGAANTVMGTMGTREEQQANLDRAEVYLPRLVTSLLHDVTGNGVTSIGVSPQAAPNLTPQQRALLTIDVQPGSLTDEMGNPISAGQVGISTVPPELVRDMLPEGLLQHTFDITVQAPGITTFSTPAPMTFPNVFHAAPGTQVNFLSFDHTTGRLVIEGTATVSPDGLSVKTDPGSGITHPGWHGTTPPGGGFGGGGGPPPDGCDPPPPPPSPPNPPPFNEKQSHGEEVIFAEFSESGYEVVDRLVEDTEANAANAANANELSGFPGEMAPRFPDEIFRFEWELPAPDNNGNDGGGGGAPKKCPPPPPPETPQDTHTIEIEIKVEGPLARLARPSGNSKDLVSGSYTVTPGNKVVFAARGRDLGELVSQGLLPGDRSNPLREVNENVLFGAKITLIAKYKSLAGTIEHEVKLFSYDFVDATDKDEKDETISFEHTAAGVARNKSIVIDRTLPESARPEVVATGLGFSASDAPFSFANVFPTILGEQKVIQFQPASADLEFNRTGKVQFHWPDSSLISEVNLEGELDLTQVWRVIDNDFTEGLRNLFNDSTVPFERKNFLRDETNPLNFDLNKAGSFMHRVKVKAQNLLAPLDPYLQESDSFGADFGTTVFVKGTSDARDYLGNSFAIAANYNEIRNVITESQRISEARRNFRLAQAINHPRQEGPVEIALRTHIIDSNIASTVGLENALAHTIAHEVGHRLGLVHTLEYRDNAPTASFDVLDVMAQGVDPAAIRTLRSSLQAAQIGLGSEWGSQEAQQAFEYYENYFRVMAIPPATSNLPQETPGSEVDEPPAFDEGLLLVKRDDDDSLVDRVDFGTVAVDGGAHSLSLALLNLGNQTVTLGEIRIEGGGGQFTVGEPTPDRQVRRSDDDESTRQIVIQFDPERTGLSSARLIIESDALNSRVEFPLKGIGRATGPQAVLDLSQNVFPAARVGGDPTVNEQLVTIVNHGSATLELSDIRIVAGESQFQLLNVPADLATHPIQLQFGETFSFGARFAAEIPGLQRARVEIVTNESQSPTHKFFITGTGLRDSVRPVWGDDFLAVETPDIPGSLALRDRTDRGGGFDFFLSPDTIFHAVFFDPETGLVGHQSGISAQTGLSIDPTDTLKFAASLAADSDGDGLPDDVEFAVGSNSGKADTDGDGVDDFTEIAADTDPLGGSGSPTGVVGALSLTGVAKHVAIHSSPRDNATPIAFVATGGEQDGGGLALVDVSQATRPLLLGQLKLTGDSQAVSIEEDQAIAVVAAGDAGVHFINIANPNRPKWIATVPIAGGAQKVDAFGGRAYVVSGKDVVSIDVATHAVLDTLFLSGGNLVDLVREGTMLFTMDDAGLLQTIDASGASLQLLGQLNVPKSASQLFVGNGIVYAASSFTSLDFPIGGYSTIDVVNPAVPQIISEPDNFNIGYGGIGLAADGSGRVILIGNPILAPALDVMNSSNLSDTDAFITRIPLSQLPFDIALADGFAYVADGTAGLQIVHYVGLDTQGKAPSATITSDVVDIDPQKSGIQLASGTPIPIRAQVQDDVLVRNVVLLVDGREAGTDVTFPFSLTAATPSTNEPKLVTIQVRATDTGGNQSVSNRLTFELIPTAPHITAAFPAPDAPATTGQSNLRLDFDRPINPAGIDPSQFELIGDGADNQLNTADDVAIVVNQLDFNVDGDQVLLQLAQPLTADHYRLTAPDTQLRDLGNHRLDGEFSGQFPTGNGRAGGDFVMEFDVVELRLDTTAFPLPHVPSIPLADNERFNALPASSIHSTLGGGNNLLLDLNNDTFPDLVRPVAGQITTFGETNTTVSLNTVSVAMGSADGTFSQATLNAVGPHPRYVLAADVNGDGTADLVTVNVGRKTVGTQTSVPLELSVLLGNGDGSFRAELRQPVGREVKDISAVFDIPGVAVGEFTGDSHPDLALLVVQSVTLVNIFFNVDAEIVILAGQGDGTFVASGQGIPLNSHASMRRRQLFVADLNGDQRQDLITPEHLLVNNGDGSFTITAAPNEEGSRIEAVIDFTGDSRPDLLSLIPFNSATVYRNTGGGNFEPAGTSPALGTTSQADQESLVTDLNGDDRLDWILNNESILWMRMGKEDFTFTTPTALPMFGSTQTLPGFIGLAAGDLKSDHVVDLAVSRGQDNSTMIVRGTAVGAFDLPIETARLGSLPLISVASSRSLAFMDGDNNLDMIGLASTFNNSGILVATGNGDGTFASGTLFPHAGGGKVFAARIDADDFVDVVSTRRNNSNETELIVYRGQGNGSLDTAVVLTSLGQVNDAVLADINGDGRLDAVGVNTTVLRVRLRAADGSFGTAVETPDAYGLARTLWVGDFNQDGRDDIALSHIPATGSIQALVRIFLANADGTLVAAGDLSAPPGSLKTALLQIGDVNQDNRLDMIVGANRENSRSVSDQLLVYFGNGNGLFPQGQLVPLDGFLIDVRLAKVNDDDHLDLVVGATNKIGVMLNHGDGTFQRPVWFDSWGPFNSARELLVADLNHDQRTDIVGYTTISLQRSVASTAANDGIADDESENLTDQELERIVAAGIERFAAAGVSAARLEAARRIAFVIADLSGTTLGVASSERITIDRNAAGGGWFVDATPLDDAEYVFDPQPRVLYAQAARITQDFDLLSVVMHELGHAMGLGHSNDMADLMFPTFHRGVRRLLSESNIDALLSDPEMSFPPTSSE